MNRTLLLSLPVLLCCFRALSGSFPRWDRWDRHNDGDYFYIEEHQYPEIIQCRLCHLQFPGEKCSRGRGICTGTREESCIIGKIFTHDGTPWMTFMGCEKNCANVNGVRWSLFLVNIWCCRSRDLCNEEY